MTDQNSLRFVCPHCHKRLRAEPKEAGTRLRCPNCGGALIVPRLAAGQPVNGSPSAPPPIPRRAERAHQGSGFTSMEIPARAIVRRDDLPNLCMRCGAPATHFKVKKFKWFPQWAFFLGGALFASFFLKEKMVQVPLCESHRKYFFWNGLATVGLVLGGFVVFFGFLALGVLGSQLADERNPIRDGLFLALGCVGLVGCQVAGIWIHLRSLRVKKITDHSITMGGVSAEFVEEMRGMQEAAVEAADTSAFTADNPFAF